MISLRTCAAILTPVTLITSLLAGSAITQAASAPPLQLETKISLGNVRGRIDHMAFDEKRQRLFVAELGNGSVGILDLVQGKLIRTLTGLKEPQGVGYEPTTDTVYVANAKDGTVQLFRGNDYAAVGQIELGDDADNVRVDASRHRVFVGYGRGAIAIIDTATNLKISELPLRTHPEGFQLDSATGQIFVNLPAARTIAVVDRLAGKQIASWPLGNRGGNFPMALDHTGRHVLSVFRGPATLGVFAMADGATVASVQSCGDSDDVFVDAKRQLAYVSCGDGFLDVFMMKGGSYARAAHIPTASGARTSLFVPELDRLLLAVPARSGTPAAIWVYRPTW